jgi:hypothetical protein
MWIQFHERLRTLGFSSYREYLLSPHWEDIKTAYRNNLTLPQHCLVCKNTTFQLHHRSYVRIGHELIGDIIPLCGECHQKVHKWLKDNNKPLSATHVAVRKIGHITRGKSKKLFSPFSHKRKKKRTTFAYNKTPHLPGQNIL